MLWVPSLSLASDVAMVSGFDLTGATAPDAASISTSAVGRSGWIATGNPAAAEEILGALRRKGIRLHLDDFGTGPSSLGALHHFPLDAVKIARDNPDKQVVFFGIGFETGYTLGALDTPLYLLFHAEYEDRISRMALGLRHERASLVPYADIDEALAFVRATFG